MLRADLYKRLKSVERYDLCVIGGGASGLGAALDAALRGWKVALFDAGDFGGGTSQTSTKLVHGGVRYLEKAVFELDWGQLQLVREALRERAFMLQNAPELTRTLGIAIPTRGFFEKTYYRVGVKCYDALAGKRNLRSSCALNAAELFAALPDLSPTRFDGGVLYFDGQFDDARYSLALATTAVAQGAALLNYARVVDFVRKSGSRAIEALVVRDELTGENFEIRCQATLNATGPQSDAVRRMADNTAFSRLRPSQGAHLVIKTALCPQNYGMLIPKTDDGRLIFVLPYRNKTLVGTTETPVSNPENPPVAAEDEISFLIENLKQYFPDFPVEQSISGVFAGYRPLVAAKKSKTEALIRNHEVEVWREHKILHLLGGKWTTYRQMAEEAIDAAELLINAPVRPCKTRDFRLSVSPPFDLENLASSVDYVVKHTFVQKVEDILRRRSELEILDVERARNLTPEIQWLLAKTLGNDKETFV